MLKKLIISETPTLIRSVKEEITTTPATNLLSSFDATRFYYWQPTPDIAIISGSSYSRIQAFDEQTSTVLDACAYSYTVDMNTGHYRIAMAISDGQGHSTEEKENIATAQIARYNCEQFLESHEPVSPDRYDEIGMTTRDASFSYHGQTIPFYYDPFNAPSATLSGVILVHRADHHDWELHVSGLGDSITVVVDGQTGEVAFSSAARMVERARAVWSPVGVQQLKENTHWVEVELLTAQEGDWVIQMTDGFWGDLSDITTIKKTDASGLNYTEERLASLLLDGQLEQMTSPSEAAHLIAHTSLKKSIEKRQCYLRLLTDTEYLAAKLPTFSSAQEDLSYTIEQWILDNQCSETLKQKIQAVQALESHDGSHFRGNRHEIPASQYLHYWTSMAFGDCSTLQIMRIPNYTQCILREWFESDPERWTHIAQTMTVTSLDCHLLDTDISAVIHQHYITGQKQHMRWNELNDARQSPLATLHGLTTQNLIDNLCLTDFPYVKAMVLAGKTPEAKAKRWACFANFLADYEAQYNMQHHHFFFRKTKNPVKIMRRAVLDHLLDAVQASPSTAATRLSSALNWTFFTEKEKRHIEQQLTPSICHIH